jgi:hypothetical protein
VTARLTVTSLALETRDAILMTDDITSELTYMVVALEEIIAAPWWRRWRVTARVRADLRASVAGIVHGGDFTERRVESIASGWVLRPGARHGRLTS